MSSFLNRSFLSATLLGSALALGGCASDPCQTTVVSTGGRAVIQDGATQWRGNERYTSVCNYRGATPQGNWDLPDHVNMQRRVITPQPQQ